MKNASRGGDGDLAEVVHDQPAEAPDLDAAIQQAFQARLSYLLGSGITSDSDST